MIKENNDRLLSLDALRGFDMFWISGGGSLFAYLGHAFNIEWLPRQLEHAQWEGFHFMDLIFPLFMFLSGLTIPYVVVSKTEAGISQKSILLKVIKRTFILILLGIAYNGTQHADLTDIRVASVLAQIGIAYLFATIIVLYTSSIWSRVIWLCGILIGYSIIQLYVPVPGFGSGVLTAEGSINGYIDRMLLPGKLYGNVSDPEGLLCVFSAIAITLMGSLAGYLVRQEKISEVKKVTFLSSSGVVLIGFALIIEPFYPIIKNCWTTPFNLLAGGISLVLFSLFYLIVDVLKWQRWCFYFRVIGMNSIFVYLFLRLVDVQHSINFIFGWVVPVFGNASQLILILIYLTVVWLLFYFMYKKKIFLKV